MSDTSKPENDENLKKKINKAFDTAWNLINTRSGWNLTTTSFLRSPTLDKLEWRRKRTSNGVGSAGGGGGTRRSSGIVYRVTATLPGSKENVVALLKDVNNMASWNRTLQVTKAYPGRVSLLTVPLTGYCTISLLRNKGTQYTKLRYYILTSK